MKCVRTTLALCTLILAGGMIAANAQTSEPPQIILRCTGFDKALKATITHFVTIKGDKGTFDDRKFTVMSSAVFYTMYNGGQRVTINRTDASYTVMDLLGAFITEWSRPEDQGCVAVTTKF